MITGRKALCCTYFFNYSFSGRYYLIDLKAAITGNKDPLRPRYFSE
jgi:hypothetical protein